MDVDKEEEEEDDDDLDDSMTCGIIMTDTEVSLPRGKCYSILSTVWLVSNLCVTEVV